MIGVKDYSAEDIAALWGISVRRVWTLFEGQPGVVVVPHPSAPHKRKFMKLRIPESAVTRVYAEMTDGCMER